MFAECHRKLFEFELAFSEAAELLDEECDPDFCVFVNLIDMPVEEHDDVACMCYSNVSRYFAQIEIYNYCLPFLAVPTTISYEEAANALQDHCHASCSAPALAEAALREIEFWPGETMSVLEFVSRYSARGSDCMKKDSPPHGKARSFQLT